MFKSSLVATVVAFLFAVLTADLPAHASGLSFGDFSNFTFNQSDAGSPPNFSGDTLQLTNGFGEARTVFDDTPQSITAFTASFAFQVGANGLTTPDVALIIQDSPQGVHAIGTGHFAYQGIADSVAISIDQIRLGGSSGLFQNGVVGPSSVSISPLDIESGDKLEFSVTYGNGRLSETITDAVSGKQFSTNYLVNLPSIIGSSTAYFGLGATSGGTGPLTQSFSDFQVVVPTPEPASWILAVLGSLGLLYVAKCRTSAFQGTAESL